MTLEATVVPDMLEKGAETRIRIALEQLYQSNELTDIWPVNGLKDPKDRDPIDKIHIILLPLERIGGLPGGSGAGVYVAYYTHADPKTNVAPSHPLVVKIGDDEKLRVELEEAKKWRTGLDATAKTRFAFPIDIYPKKPDGNKFGKTVLIALFGSVYAIAEGSRHRVEVLDLWRLLHDENELSSSNAADWKRISDLVVKALDAVEQPHRAGLSHPIGKSTTYSNEYDRYLRKTIGGYRKHIPELLFGTGPKTKVLGQDWPNPRQLIARIINNSLPFEGILGAVHGDLHPKNIVLGKGDDVRIIDFGWAALERHVVVDYLLLDLNIRATTMPSHRTEADILSLAGFLDREDNPDALPASVRERGRIIKDVIWRKANDAKVAENWTAEYLIPLFIVGYGLLVYLDDARNQTSLIATVLKLTERLSTVIVDSEGAST